MDHDTSQRNGAEHEEPTQEPTGAERGEREPERITMLQFRRQMRDVMERVEHAGATVVVTRFGEPAVVLTPARSAAA